MEEKNVLGLGGMLGSSHITFEKPGCFIPSNTRARRLGAIIFLLGKINNGTNIEGLLTNLPKEDLELLKENFFKEKIINGELTSKGSSIIHYLDLCQEISLVIKQGSLFSITNSGKLLCNLVKDGYRHPYPLAQSIRNLFFLLILKNDFLGLKALAHILMSGKRSLAGIKNEFLGSLKAVFSETSIKIKEPQIVSRLRDRLLSFNSWKKPFSYSAHLVTPRVYWLSDLGLLTVSGKRELEIVLSQEQEKFFQKLLETPYLKEPQFYTLALSYFSLFPEKNLSIAGRPEDFEMEVEKALDEIFSLFSPSTNLQKIRADIAGIFFLSQKYSLVEKLNKMGLPLNEVINRVKSQRWKYQVHLAARPTQSYIVRFPK